MAYEFLNKTTDAMFKQTNLTTQSIGVAMIFYEYTLMQPKFKHQRYHFQLMLSCWSFSFAEGYFNTRRKELSSEVRNKLYNR